ncbi:MAG TPA: hypothetical protein VGX21_07360 [Methylomirabilota bacterium]|jgi:uncharacterized protein YciI|nr:hypothetical protein [Methylomirabilota bacterium]
MAAMIVVHVTATNAADYFTRREPHRAAHIERLVGLRDQGRVIGGGPAPDGRTAELFYRLRQPGDLKLLVEEDPYFTGGAWTAYTSRSFAQFVEPWGAVPVVLDGSRRATIVEGPAIDSDLAQLALVELRGAGRLRFGGSFDGQATLAVLGSADAAEATGWLAATGLWALAALTARPWLHVL